MAVDHEKQDGVIVWQVRNRESARHSVTNLKLNPVARLQWRLHLLASLVRHPCFLCDFLRAALVDIEGGSVGVGVANAEPMRELQRPHETPPRLVPQGSRRHCADAVHGGGEEKREDKKHTGHCSCCWRRAGGL